MIKLNVLLAKTDHLQSVFQKGIEEFAKFFKSQQGQFKGEKKTFEANSNIIESAGDKVNKLVVTTVDEKFKWLEDGSSEYIDALFSMEAINASGNAKAELKVGDISFGTFTSLELLRLKSLLENGKLIEMYETIPVRNDDEIWTLCSNDMYKNKAVVYESDLLTGVKKTTLKESYILPDPNLSKDTGAKYVAQIAQKDSVIELGKFTFQRFSGEYSHLQRAEILQRRSILLSAVIVALKVANEGEVVESTMTAEKLFNYLHRGTGK